MDNYFFPKIISWNQLTQLTSCFAIWKTAAPEVCPAQTPLSGVPPARARHLRGWRGPCAEIMRPPHPHPASAPGTSKTVDKLSPALPGRSYRGQSGSFWACAKAEQSLAASCLLVKWRSFAAWLSVVSQFAVCFAGIVQGQLCCQVTPASCVSQWRVLNFMLASLLNLTI